MAVSLSIKNVPDTLAEAVRERARRNHRSLQGELMAILESAVSQDFAGGGQVREPVSTWARSARGPRASERQGRLGTAGEPAGDNRRQVPAGEPEILARQVREGRTFRIQDLRDYVRSLGLKTPSESAGWIRRMRDAR